MLDQWTRTPSSGQRNEIADTTARALEEGVRVALVPYRNGLGHWAEARDARTNRLLDRFQLTKQMLFGNTHADIDAYVTALNGLVANAGNELTNPTDD